MLSFVLLLQFVFVNNVVIDHTLLDMLDQRRLICGVGFYVVLGYLACFVLLIG